MDVVTLRVRGYNKRKDFHFTITEEAAKFQEYMMKLDVEEKLTYEILSSSIDNTVSNIRELGKRPETYAEKAYKEMKAKGKK